MYPVPRRRREPLRPAGDGAVGARAASRRAAASSRTSRRAQPLSRPGATSTCCGSRSTSTRSAARAQLYRYLRAVFDADYPPTSLHRLLARLPRAARASAAGRSCSSLTTNYDDLVERALADGGRAVRRRLVRGEARRRSQGCFLHRRPTARSIAIERPNKYAGLALDGAAGRFSSCTAAIDRADPKRRQLRRHRGQLHRLPLRRRRRRADPDRAARADDRQPLPLPRLLDARLEPARDPQPDLGRRSSSTVKSWAVQREPADPRRARSRRRSGATAATSTLALRRAEGVRRAARARALRRGPRMTDDAAADTPPPPRPRAPYVGLVPYGEEDAGFFFGRDEDGGSSPPTCARRG